MLAKNLTLVREHFAPVAVLFGGLVITVAWIGLVGYTILALLD